MSLSRLSSVNPLETPVASLFFTNYSSSLLSVYLQQRERYYTADAWAALIQDLTQTRTLYAGNLSPLTDERQIFEYFSLAGEIDEFHMGLNHLTHQPTGFCFVSYFSHRDAENARLYLSGSLLDEKSIKIDLDQKFEEGRQWGRAKSGGQIIEDVKEKILQSEQGMKRKALENRLKDRQKNEFTNFKPASDQQTNGTGTGSQNSMKLLSESMKSAGSTAVDRMEENQNAKRMKLESSAEEFDEINADEPDEEFNPDAADDRAQAGEDADEDEADRTPIHGNQNFDEGEFDGFHGGNDAYENDPIESERISPSQNHDPSPDPDDGDDAAENHPESSSRRSENRTPPPDEENDEPEWN